MRKNLSFKKRFKWNKEIINQALRRYLEKEKGFSNEIFAAMEYALFPGGKRLRPVLCLEASKACGGSIKNAIPVACTIEFIHNFSLIHDDLPSMDNDDFRRGKPTLHKKFGEAVAILAGDALLILAFSILSGIKNRNISLLVMKKITDSIGLKGVIGGQGLDIKYMSKKKTKSLESKINSLKTAKLFQVSLISGAIVAHASSIKIKKLDFFGRHFGNAFQVYDDIKDNAYRGTILTRKVLELTNLIDKAKSALDIFGKKADNLRCIADSLEAKL